MLQSFEPVLLIDHMVRKARHGFREAVEIQLGALEIQLGGLRESVDPFVQSVDSPERILDRLVQFPDLLAHSRDFRLGIVHPLRKFAQLTVVRFNGLPEKLHPIIFGHLTLIVALAVQALQSPEVLVPLQTSEPVLVIDQVVREARHGALSILPRVRLAGGHAIQWTASESLSFDFCHLTLTVPKAALRDTFNDFLQQFTFPGTPGGSPAAGQKPRPYVGKQGGKWNVIYSDSF
jgi:hypothetical protein